MKHSANFRFIGVFYHEKISFVNNASVSWFENLRYRNQVVAKKKINKSLFPQIFRIFYYSEFLVLELKSRRTKFITTLSGKTLSGKVFVRKNYSLGRATKFQKNLPFFP